MPDLGVWGQYGRLTKKVRYGHHTELRCKNHPDNRYFTKNIAPIGARTIFNNFDGYDCSCGAESLEVVEYEGPDLPDR